MNDIDKLLEYVQKTNPEMTRDRLIEELGKCRYSAAALIISSKNHAKFFDTPLPFEK